MHRGPIAFSLFGLKDRHFWQKWLYDFYFVNLSLLGAILDFILLEMLMFDWEIDT